MNKNNQKQYLIITLIMIMLLPLLLAATPSGTAELPPRPTDEPKQEKKEPGAFIQLQVSGVAVGTEGVWTVVQWVDEFDMWHDVTGWQGTVDSDGTQTWWVAPDDMGRGPFRWVVLTAKDGATLAASELFDLPDQRKMTQVVSVTIE